MNKLKIALFGYDAYTGQIPRYREAVIDLGHELTFENPDIIYANDPTGYKDAIQLKKIFPSSLAFFITCKVFSDDIWDI